MAFLAAGFSTLAGAAGLTTTQAVALGLTAGSAIMGGRAASQSAKLEAKMAEQDARYEDLRAADAIGRGVEQQDKIQLQLRRILGSQRAGYGAGNIDTGTGSPLTV